MKKWHCIICGFVYDEAIAGLKTVFLRVRSGMMFPMTGCALNAVSAKVTSKWSPYVISFSHI